MRNRYILLADIAATGAAAYGAFVLRFDWFVLQYPRQFLLFLGAAAVLKPSVFFTFGMYRRYWRYSSLRDLQAMVLASTIASALLAILVSVAVETPFISWFSRSVLVIDWLLMTSLMAGIRLSVRVIGESRPGPVARPGIQKRVLIVGAGDAGTMVVREMQRNPQMGLTPVGFLDDDTAKQGKQIYGVRVLGETQELEDIATASAIDEVVIAMPRAAGAAVRKVTNACQRAGVVSLTMPGMYELLDGNVSVSRLRTVEIADLLRRTQVVGGPESAMYVTGRCVVVTGGGGSIGLELCRQLAHARPSCLAILGHGENSVFEALGQLRDAFPAVKVEPVIADIRDAQRIHRIFQALGPAVVFHAAAHKHVPLMEQNPGEAVTNNIIGTQNVVDAALRVRAERFVLISTDKAVAPSSLMGASKRFAELLVRAAAERSGLAFAVVRFGNVLGSRGSVVPIFKQQIDRGGPITITHPDMKRFFMTIPEAVHLVLEAAGLAVGGELFVLNMGQPVRIVDLAEDLITLSGLSRDEIPIVFTGVRPGEKLEESLWDQKADVEPTSHPEILRVSESQRIPTPGALAEVLRTLEDLGRADDRAGIETVLAQWLPTFMPSYARNVMTNPETARFQS
jgi:FlaA1/EpsC-like NDP-sugar epimerase